MQARAEQSKSLILHGKGMIDEVLTIWEPNTLQQIEASGTHVHDLKSISPDITEITFVGHSNDNPGLLELSSNKAVSGHGATAMAKLISSKYGQSDKTKLTDFYLLSCEAGLRVNNEPSFAERFATQMRAQGFTNLKVHACTCPPGITPAGMRVEIPSVPLTDKTKINAYYYKSAADEKRDKKTYPRNNVMAQNSPYRTYVFKDKNYKEEMKKPLHTIQAKTMSEDVVAAIDFLGSALSRLKNTAPKDHRVARIEKALKTLKADPDKTIDEIIDIVTKIKSSETKSMIQAFVGADTKPSNYDTFVIDMRRHLNACKITRESLPARACDVVNRTADIVLSSLSSAIRITDFFTPTPSDAVTEPTPKRNLRQYIEDREAERDASLAFYIFMVPAYLAIDLVNGHYGANSAEGHFDPVGRDGKIQAGNKVLRSYDIAYEYTKKTNEVDESYLELGSKLGKLAAEFGNDQNRMKAEKQDKQTATATNSSSWLFRGSGL